MSQRISDFRTGKPFGDGTDGDLVISANATWGTGNPSVPISACNGSAGANTLGVASPGGFANGDLIFIHHTRGTNQNTGGWEVNKIVSGGGTGTFTLQNNLSFTYTDGGADQSQVIKIFEYDDVTVNPGVTWTLPVWNQDLFGIMVFAAKGVVNIGGTIDAKGLNSPTQGNFNGGAGYGGGGNKQQTGTQSALTGEGTPGTQLVVQNGAANGNGGGGGHEHDPNSAGGGGGGNGANGAAGGGGGGQAIVGAGGGTAGSADLSLMNFGGGGGGGAMPGGNVGGGGGVGGGDVVIFTKEFTIPGIMTGNGGNGNIGHSPDGAGGGGGAGGSLLVKCQTAALGSNRLTATGGAGGSSGGNAGGAGGVGRISIHHSGPVTGTTNPAFNDTFDSTLREAVGGAFLLNMV